MELDYINKVYIIERNALDFYNQILDDIYDPIKRQAIVKAMHNHSKHLYDIKAYKEFSGEHIINIAFIETNTFDIESIEDMKENEDDLIRAAAKKELECLYMYKDIYYGMKKGKGLVAEIIEDNLNLAKTLETIIALQLS